MKILMKSIQYLLIFIFIIAISQNQLFSKPVSLETALKAAQNFYLQRMPASYSTELKQINIKLQQTIKSKDSTLIYIFDVENYGFIMVSADDAAIPILGYSYENKYEIENQAPSFQWWMNNYKNQIEEIKIKSLSSSKEIDSLWTSLINSDSKKIKFSGKAQNPLLLTTWDQNGKYNALCPAEQFGPGGHVYAGCVAVAMAQVMYYYKYPQQGVGTYSYFHQNYGLLSADFGNTTYKWNEMANQMPNEGNFEIAQLLYHCGVSVDMNYTASGSGAWSNLVVSSLIDYFGYDNSVNIDNKSNYSNTQWANKIIESLDNKIPLYYHGYPAAGGSGHAFNLDGYQGNDYFHFNWGWSGSYNGYFYLNNLNPGNYDFASWQGAIFNIKPDSNYYPIGCQSSKILTASQGILFDGSGPNNYVKNQNCSWLIEPLSNIANIELNFNQLDLAVGDTIIIYDGSSQTDSVLMKITGNNIPSKISATGKKMLVRMISDGMFEGEGFDASYKSTFPIFCQGILVINDSLGKLTDGSDSNNYNNNAMCRWLIESPLHKGIQLKFTKFDTESGEDWVKIYDPTTTPSQLLGQFSGNQIPSTIFASNGKMLIVFASNESNTFSGWEAIYYTGNVGIKTNEIEHYKIYPNPINDWLQIEGLEINQQNVIRIVSLEGRILISERISGTLQTRINTNTLKPGIYLIEIENSNNKTMYKIVKTKMAD